MVIIISAIGSQHVIGDGNKLPWHIPEEYNQFLDFVTDQTALMGRRSFELFRKDRLPKRNVVISSTFETERASVFPSLQEALAYAKTFPEDVYICGGQAIYEEALPLADYMYLSFVKGEHEGNVYFPNFDEEDWIVESEEEHEEFVFVIYRRKVKL